MWIDGLQFLAAAFAIAGGQLLERRFRHYGPDDWCFDWGAFRRKLRKGS